MTTPHEIDAFILSVLPASASQISSHFRTSTGIASARYPRNAIDRGLQRLRIAGRIKFYRDGFKVIWKLKD